jgi:cAMP-dependent protein kinase regulator
MAAQENQEYIQQKVNPILENLVTQLLLERPENISQFMISWLSEHSKHSIPLPSASPSDELEGLKAELAALQKEVTQLEAEEQSDKDIPPADDDNASEEDDDEEGPDIDDMPPPSSYVNKGQRSSVSAEAYGAWNTKESFKPPVYPKTDTQKLQVRDVLQHSFLFSSLDPSDVNIIIDATQEKCVATGTRVIQQGDDGDVLFVVEEGALNCYKKFPGSDEEKLVKKYSVGDAFGELALLYNCPRAASVVAEGDCKLWTLDRQTFNHIVKDAASNRRQKYEEFLTRVPILQHMDSYERTSLCDAFTSQTVQAGEVIISQGESGDKFFILEEGEAAASKVYVPGAQPRGVMKYKPGDYFGELALLKNEPREATVTAETVCKLLVLPRKTFKSFLGPLEDMLLRNASQLYEVKNL